MTGATVSAKGVTEGRELARAKINLTLHVGRVIADADRFYGYHPLDSLVVFANMGDRLDFTPAEDLSLSISGPFGAHLDADEDNLVTRAARLSGRTDVAIALKKCLPVASGLGGGSADAAATLRHLGEGDLTDIALQIGADVPACVMSRTLRMTGIGETLSPLPGLGTVAAVIANPGVAVSTGEIFRRFDARTDVRETPRPQLARGTLLERARDGRNDLEPVAITLQPVIGDLIAMMDTQPGCDLARMSGSGASVFGLFETDIAAIAAAKAISASGWWAVACRLGDEPSREPSSEPAG